MPATKADYDRLGAWAVMYEADLNIDRRQSPGRTVPLEVLHFAFPRTGSLSMTEAYQILGYKNPYHYSSIFSNVRDCDMWIPMLKAKRRGERVPKRDFDQLLGHCGAVTDVPCLIFWRELLEAYPDAKVILVERNEQAWFASFKPLLRGLFNPVLRYVVRWGDPQLTGRVATVASLWIEALCGCSDLQGAIDNSVPAMRRHYDEVRKSVPEERLLVYQLGSGWDPLCRFLEKPVPNVPFPHRNESKALAASIGEYITKGLKNVLFNLLAVMVGIVGVVILGTKIVG